MSLSLYETSVPVYTRLLGLLDAALDKAVAHASEAKFPPEVLFTARLAPNMWSFAEQVKAATNHAFRGTARLAGLPIPAIPDAVDSLAALKARIAATLDFINSADPAAVDAGETREITFPLGDRQATLTGKQYLLGFTLPNFYFHLTTAYDILRHNGVPLHKTDFMGGV